MPHQCIHCSHIYEKAGSFLLEGCEKCGGRFFFFIKEEQMNKLREEPNLAVELPKEEKERIEADIREMAGIPDENAPVILDLEAVRVLGTGKYEIDVVNLFKKNQPLIYKIEEGKYIIDLSSLNRG
jgi:predicted  nucleic acid-binding Zn-ribbon protein